MNSIVCPSLLCHLNNWNLALSGGPQKAQSAFAAANRYWVRLALATAVFLFPWPVSQTRSGLLRVQPIEASILTLTLEHRLERVANNGLTETEELCAARKEEAHTSTPTLHVHLSIKPSALVHWRKYWSSFHSWISGHMGLRERLRPEVKNGRLKCRWSILK